MPRPRWGARLLRRWLTRPIRNRDALAQRLHAVGALIEDGIHERTHALLDDVGDLERILSRIGLATARPRDLAQLRDACTPSRDCAKQWPAPTARAIRELTGESREFPEIAALLDRAVVETPPVLVRDGGVLAKGYDAELDELRRLSHRRGRFPRSARSARARAHRGPDP